MENTPAQDFTTSAAPAGAAPAGERGTGPGGRPRGRGRGRYTPRRKICTFCVDKIKLIDYKDIGRLRRFLSEDGKIESRRKSGNCARHQRMLSGALKRARHLALLPYTGDHVRELGGGFGFRGATS